MLHALVTLSPLTLLISASFVQPAPTPQEQREKTPDAVRVAPVEPLEIEGLAPLHRVGKILLGGQPTEVALEALAWEGMKTVIDLRRTSEERGFDEAEVASVLELDYVLLGFGGPDPLTDEIFHEARRVMREHREGDLLLHCASSNRVGAVWLTRRVLDEGVDWKVALEEARSVGLRSPPLEEAARAYVLGAGNQEFGRFKEELRAKLPQVKGITVDQLARSLEKGRAPLLLDVREPAEYAVSHLRGARRASTIDQALGVLEGSARDQEVVVYCSVGYRSGHLAAELGKAGFSKVRNLEGSIFEWANTGHPVHRDGVLVREVHPYDKKWGRFLNRNLWSKLED